MGTLSKLLQYKKEVTIVDPKNGTEMAKVWVRLLGDQDLRDAYQKARIASSETRKALRDADSIMYKDAIAQLDDVPKENLIAIIVASQENNFQNEASVIVIREDLPTIEQISSRPDAPSLEEQEILDARIAETNKKYEDAVNEYIETRRAELQAAIAELPDEEIVVRAKNDLSNIQALESFVNELNDWRGYLGTYDDKECKNRSFDNIEDFKNSASELKAQIIAAYMELEVSTEEIKNS